MQEQLKPLAQQLLRVKDLPVPDFGTLQAWEARANAANRANGDPSANDSSKSSQGHGYGGTPMPFLGDTKVKICSLLLLIVWLWLCFNSCILSFLFGYENLYYCRHIKYQFDHCLTPKLEYKVIAVEVSCFCYALRSNQIFVLLAG